MQLSLVKSSIQREPAKADLDPGKLSGMLSTHAHAGKTGNQESASSSGENVVLCDVQRENGYDAYSCPRWSSMSALDLEIWRPTRP